MSKDSEEIRRNKLAGKKNKTLVNSCLWNWMLCFTGKDKSTMDCSDGKHRLVDKCIKFNEDSSKFKVVSVCMDEYQYFISWKSQKGEIKSIDTTDIRDIRMANCAKMPKESHILKKSTEMSSEKTNPTERIISICIGEDFINLRWFHFIPSTMKFAKELYQVILNQLCNPKLRNINHFLHTQKIWKKICVETPDQIDISKLIHYLALHNCGRQKFYSVFNDVAMTNNKIIKTGLTLEYFMEICEKLFFEYLFDDIYKKISPDKENLSKQMDCGEFTKFLNEVQRDDSRKEKTIPPISENEARTIILTYESNTKLANQGIISKKGLLMYLFSEDNIIVDHSNFQISQDMDQPLNHYFINSSHNTYLEGKQLFGKAKAEIYRQVLLSGCRCVELDIWDGKKENELIITHGYTMCQPLPLEEALDTISEYAFKTSDYPLILSFENHCSSREQGYLYQIVTEKLGDKLLMEPLLTNPLDSDKPLPSPEQLRGKILIKDKKNTSKNNKNNEEDSKHKKSKQRDEGISSIVNYVQSTSFEHFQEAEEKRLNYGCWSFEEKEAKINLTECPKEFINYNKRQFSRIYPNGLRILSSNYLPQLFWNAGCQLAALNFEILDCGMQLNLAMFDYQNRCGYLLKPLEMRSDTIEFDPFPKWGVEGVVPKTLNITIISGQFISRKDTYCYVEVEMYGLPCDSVKNKYKIKSTSKTGLNPRFSNTVVKFDKIVYPKLAQLRLLISTEDKSFAGHILLPVDQIKPGYRFINFKNKSAQPLTMPSLLVFIEIRDYCMDILAAMDYSIDLRSDKEFRMQQLENLSDEFATKLGLELQNMFSLESSIPAENTDEIE